MNTVLLRLSVGEARTTPGSWANGAWGRSRHEAPERSTPKGSDSPFYRMVRTPFASAVAGRYISITGSLGTGQGQRSGPSRTTGETFHLRWRFTQSVNTMPPPHPTNCFYNILKAQKWQLGKCRPGNKVVLLGFVLF